MSGKQKRFKIFSLGFSLPLPDGNIYTLCKEDHQASCLYTEYYELCKLSNLTIKQQEKKKQIIAVLKEKIAMMKIRNEAEKRRLKEIASNKMDGIQLSLFHD